MAAQHAARWLHRHGWQLVAVHAPDNDKARWDVWGVAYAAHRLSRNVLCILKQRSLDANPQPASRSPTSPCAVALSAGVTKGIQSGAVAPQPGRAGEQISGPAMNPVLYVRAV